MEPSKPIQITEQYHPDLMVTAILHDKKVVAAVYDHELFNNGVQVYWN